MDDATHMYGRTVAGSSRQPESEENMYPNDLSSNSSTPALPKPRRGFSLIELVIVVVIIGIIAAIAIPRMSRGSAGAADSALASNLAILRNAIDIYHTEHDKYPPLDTFANQLTMYTNLDGSTQSATKNTATKVIYGPYLRRIPPIPVGTKKGATGVATADGVGVAWIYNETTGAISANLPADGVGSTDSVGNPYSGY